MPSRAILFWSLSLLAVPEQEPRLELVESQVAGRNAEALLATESLLAAEPERARDLWLPYLQAHLLEAMGRDHDAHQALTSLLNAKGELAAYGRLRLAQLQQRMGHPEVAAGLVATLLGKGTPEALVEEATSLLVRTLRDGGDCRLLGRLPAWEVPEDQRRRLRLAEADCTLSEGDTTKAGQELRDLLLESTNDLVAREAAVRLERLPPAMNDSARTKLRMGMAFHNNREFDRSTQHLGEGLNRLDPENLTLDIEEMFAYRYADARGHFWLRRYREAALRFQELAEVAYRAELRADCLYQEGRSRELAGDWKMAAEAFRRSYLADRVGEWSGASLLSAMRVEFRSGSERQALDLFDVLRSRLAWRGLAHRAALFLSASDLVRGRADRASQWLQFTPSPSTAEELLYWQGRAAEIQDSPYLAIRNYVAILRNRPHHPLATEARKRLAGEELAPLIEPVAQQLAASNRRTDLHSSWLLFGDDDPTGKVVRTRLGEILAADRRVAPYLELQAVAVKHWPLWNALLTRPGEHLLALGLWEQGEPYVLRHFPVSEPSLALTGSLHLAAAGRTRASMYIAEILDERLPSWVPPSFLPMVYRRLLYPYPYRDLIERQARRAGIEPELLAGLIREESRFDPDAVSAASARGLAQFVYPTALQLAGAAGLSGLEPEQLNDPKVSIALGAAYLAQLLQRFGGRVEMAITAYNAGEDQTRLWASHCFSLEPAEYFSKVGFPQTRSYLRKVLSSRGQYRELYGADAPTAAAP